MWAAKFRGCKLLQGHSNRKFERTSLAIFPKNGSAKTPLCSTSSVTPAMRYCVFDALILFQGRIGRDQEDDIALLLIVQCYIFQVSVSTVNNSEVDGSGCAECAAPHPKSFSFLQTKSCTKIYCYSKTQQYVVGCKIVKNPSIVENLDWSISLLRVFNL